MMPFVRWLCNGGWQVYNVDKRIQEDNLQHLALFSEYGRMALQSESLRQFYAEVAERTNIPIFALAVADFMKPPTIEEVDLSPYNGQIGDLIMLTATDNFGVKAVRVMITNAEGNAIESGVAVESPSGPGHWVYTATASVPAGDTANFRIVATDRPGGSAVVLEAKFIQP